MNCFSCRFLFVLLFTAGVVSQGVSQPKKTPLPQVDPITNAVLKELLDKHSGKVVLVNAWATWCKPCKEEIPDLVKLKNAYAEKGFVLVFISADDADELNSAVRPALQTLGIDFLTYINQDSSDEAFINGLNPKWNGALPASFLYDRQGRLSEMMIGGRKYKQFEDALLKLLSTKM